MDRIALQILEDGWCKVFLATVRDRYREDLGG